MAKQKRRGVTVWLTGLSDAGKTTLGQVVATELKMQGYQVEVLDGDVVRQYLSRGLGFSQPEAGKFWVYEQVMRIPFYGIYQVNNGTLEV